MAYSSSRAGTACSPKGGRVKKDWQPMRLRFVGQVSQLMRGENGSNVDPGHGLPQKLGGG
jgi:hypothetical protein